MKLAEKLKKARTDAGLTQSELASKAGITLRMLVRYEQGEHYPRKREIYLNLANALSVPQEYLLADDEMFVIEAAERYGYRGAMQAEDLLRDFAQLRASEEMCENDEKAVVKSLQQIFWESKVRNKEKYTPRQYRAGSTAGLRCE